MVLDGINLLTESAGNAITITQLSEITQEGTERFFTIEKEAQDIANGVADYNGCELSGMNMNIQTGSISTVVFNLMGKTESSHGGALPTTVTAATTSPVLNAIDNVLGIFELEENECIRNFTFTMTNNLRDRQCIGTLGPESIGSGRAEISGTFEKYFENRYIIDKYLDFIFTKLALIMEDSLGNALIRPSIRPVDSRSCRLRHCAWALESRRRAGQGWR